MESLYAQQLQDVLLSWDYWELEKNASEGRGLFDKLPTIPVRFSSVDEYVRTFEPLLLEECAAQLLRRLEEGQASSGRRGVASASTNRGGPRPAAVLARVCQPRLGAACRCPRPTRRWSARWRRAKMGR